MRGRPTWGGHVLSSPSGLASLLSQSEEPTDATEAVQQPLMHSFWDTESPDANGGREQGHTVPTQSSFVLELILGPSKYLPRLGAASEACSN